MKYSSFVSRFVMLAGCTALVACGGGDDDSAGNEKIRIGWLAKGADNDFFDLSRNAANLAAEDLTAASGRQVEVVHLDAVENTPEAQLERIQAAKDMNLDAVDISVLKPEITTPAIDELVDSGIPVLTFDSDAPDSKRTTFYGISNLDGAIQAANLLAKLMGEEGQVAIMTAAGAEPGTLSTSATYTERMSGFLDTMAAKYPNIDVVTTVTCSKAEETDFAGCTGILEQVMADYPDLSGFYLSRGRVLREADIVNLAPNYSAAVQAGDLKVVGFDMPQDALHSMKSGVVNAVFTQDYFGWGYDVVNLTFDHITIGRQFEPFTDSGIEIVCPNNIDELSSMWDQQDFRSQLEPCDL